MRAATVQRAERQSHSHAVGPEQSGKAAQLYADELGSAGTRQLRHHQLAQLIDASPRTAQMQSIQRMATGSTAPVQRQAVVQRKITIGADEKSLIWLAVQLQDYMGDYDYAKSSLDALDGNTYATMDLLKAAMPAPLTANQVYCGGLAVTIAGRGGRCNEHMSHGLVVAALRKNKGSLSIADDSNQRIQIGAGIGGSWKMGYVCLQYTGGQFQYWHAHDGFAVG
jgi:hypothetical protein